MAFKDLPLEDEGGGSVVGEMGGMESDYFFLLVFLSGKFMEGSL